MNLPKPRVAILGATGMIGSAIYSILKDTCDLVVVYRNPVKFDLLLQKYGPLKPSDSAIPIDFFEWEKDYTQGFAGQLHSHQIQSFINQLSHCDWIINAAGITKAIANDNPEQTMFINGALPHILTEIFGNKLIHITTDCVFNGATNAPYDENSLKSPVDLYGLSKSVGEPSGALIIRTSTIGPELGTTHGLLEWLRSQSGRSVPGFINHQWNGVTSFELGKILQRLILTKSDQISSGLYHIFSNDISKRDLLIKLNQKFNLNCVINPTEAPIAIDRRLRSIKNLNDQLCPASLDEMLTNL